MAVSFDCAICADSHPEAQRFRCPSCEFDTCKTCQKTFLQPECMNCRITLTRGFLQNALGKAWVNGPLRNHVQGELMTREKALLRDTVQDVERVRLERQTKEQARFGRAAMAILQQQLPQSQRGRGQNPNDAADAFDANKWSFPCPIDACKGFVTASTGTCGLCKSRVCGQCMKAVPTVDADAEGNARAHVCVESDAESVRMMKKDSRPCPRCSVFIFRIDGCDHMHCTNCGVHWNWKTRKTMKKSTNHHYAHLETFRRRNGGYDTESGECGEGGQGDDACPHEGGQEDDHNNAVNDLAVARSIVGQREGGEPPSFARLVTLLYDDESVVRFAARNKFDPVALTRTHDTALHASRVNFLLDEIDEATWAKRVYQTTQVYERGSHTARVFELYTASVRDFRRRLLSVLRSFEDASSSPSTSTDKTSTELLIDQLDRLLGEAVGFVELCNTSLVSLRSEYGGPEIRIRSDPTDADHPPLSMV